MRAAVEAVARLSWRSAFLGMLLHFVLSWAGMLSAGEDLAGSATGMLYFYVTTGTTVGYGDLSPQTEAGRIFTALWIMPGAIAGFGWLLGKIIATITTAARKAATGMASFETRKGHNVFIGYLPGQTDTLIAETEQGQERSVLITTQDLEERVPADVDWVRAEALSNLEALTRAGVASAQRVVIMTGDDEITTSICLAMAGDFPKVRAVALFNERHKAELVGKACPNVRAVVAPASLLLARAASSDHAELVIDQLLSSRIDDALRTAVFLGAPTGAVSFRELQAKIIDCNDAVPIGVTLPDGGKMDLAPSRDLYVHGGTLIHYVGSCDYAGFDDEGRGVRT